MTILGDIAQATGPVVYDRWNEIIAHLGNEPGAAEVAELRHAYRVPAEIMGFALPLLDVVAPGVARPVAFRSGAARLASSRSLRESSSRPHCARPSNSPTRTGSSP